LLLAVRVREELLGADYDCVAVPLPGSWREQVLEAVERLPAIQAVIQRNGDDDDRASYVPIDPCQPVIAALRLARRERIAIEFVDLETVAFEPRSVNLSDPYALRKLPVEKFAAGMLPGLPPPKSDGQQDRRNRRMAFELHRLELERRRILFLPNVLDWPYIREAYRSRAEYPEHETYFAPMATHPVDARTHAFFLGELPFITALFERARGTLDPDEHLAIDGIKELLLVARERWRRGRDEDTTWLGPKLLQLFLTYARNLTLLQRRLSPDLYTLVVAAKQIAGDGFGRAVLETARDYPIEHPPLESRPLRMGLGQADVPDLGVVAMQNRLPGVAVSWRSCELKPEATPAKKRIFQLLWNPYEQCSHTPEDRRIENFQTHVREQAKQLIGQDLAKTEKFTSSVKDGVDIRETLRNWHKGEIHVREFPPARGGLEIVLFLFDVPADPDKYAWRTTWNSEFDWESLIGFFATNPLDEMIGPGIAKAKYGGVFFLYPPRDIPDIWSDRRLPKAKTLEERLISAAVFHSKQPHVAVVSPCPLKAAWKALARAHGKRLVHLPLSRFSARTVDRLRTFHVLNGKRVRSYAARFIRDD
ncbi:MAG TPA: hypothetical protein VNC50_05785, partial [Planctomycetia bacterium]|nr:hypothetical protein [Planctomycetia bacterium]